MSVFRRSTSICLTVASRAATRGDLRGRGCKLRLCHALIGLEANELRLGGFELRFHRIEAGTLGIACRPGRIVRRLGGDAARAQLALALVSALGVGEQRPVAGDLRFDLCLGSSGLFRVRAHALDLRFLHQLLGAGLLEIGARRIELGEDLVRIEPRHHLPRLHIGIVVGKELDDLARELRADDDCRGWIDGAARTHRGNDFAFVCLGESVGRLGRRAAPVRKEMECARSGSGDGKQSDQQAAHL